MRAWKKPAPVRRGAPASSSGTSEGALIDDGRSGGAKRARPRQIVFGQGTAWSGTKPASRELLDELLASQEALRFTRELGEDETLPSHGLESFR